MGVVEPPRDSIQNTRYAILRDAPAKQRISLKCAESVVLYFGVRWGGALSDEVEVNIGAKRGRIEQNEPYVDAQFRLDWCLISNNS